MESLPFILADAGPIIGVIFLILWGIISLMNVAKKQRRQPQDEQEGFQEFPEFPSMEESTPPPPPPAPWPPREQRPKPVHRPGPVREESEWNQRPAPWLPRETQTPRESRPPRPARQAREAREAREARRDPNAPRLHDVLKHSSPLAADLGEAVTDSDIARSEIGGDAHSAGDHRSERARRIARQLTPRRAREAILMAEVLAPPVALRDRPI